MEFFELVSKYKLTQMETKVLKLCYIWEDLCRKEFPKWEPIRVRTKSDPRKSTLFRYCYKLMTETKGLIKDSEYRLYIQAQLSMLNSFRKKDESIFLSPAVLVGQNAWKRWKYWKYIWDKREQTSSDESVTPEYLVLEELRKTYTFLSGKTTKLTKEFITESIKSGELKKWIFYQKISPYYVVLSPLSDGNTFGIDFDVYKRSVNDNIIDFFKNKFSYEF